MQPVDRDGAARADEGAARFGGQPFAEVERDGVRFVLLGTAHVSRASVEAVEQALAGDAGYDLVAVELDAQRHAALNDPDAMARLDLLQVIRSGRTPVFAANLGLAAYQRRLAEQLGIEPGAELKAAAMRAAERGLPLALVDRDVGVTFRRALASLGFWGRAKISAGLLMSLFADEEVSEADIEKLKSGDMLESSFGDFARENPALYRSIIAERDEYMAAALRETAQVHGARHVLAVLGAGHLKGVAAHLAEQREAPDAVRARLIETPQGSRIPWFTIALAVLVFGGFAWGFWQGGVDLGGALLLHWVLATGFLGALGCAIAGGHPLSILAAFVSSPITPLHPALASGTVSALVETWMRKPTYADFMALRDDVATVRGWWRNRVSRILLNFFLTSLGTAIGVWTGGLSILRRLV
ncbi:TraB/GumN family protein [Coralloluteibacterium stylophorae]|uniref:TraB/GumN family protein n=2 Tax=Coralloluteibacterium stylophorae TaxID=1776034 RepID=A0A8J7VX38_9GAMM|nr:TraB/GumN family protein [Coralloluteibacterium stylophorae]